MEGAWLGLGLGVRARVRVRVEFGLGLGLGFGVVEGAVDEAGRVDEGDLGEPALLGGG